MPRPLDTWFAAEILPHEAALTRFIRRIWSNPEDVADLRQEIYARIYEGAREKRPVSAKAFLFAIARHLIIDRARRDRVVSIDFTQDLEALNVLLIDDLSPERRLTARQELRRLSEALDRLPPRCREVLWVRRIEGLSQREAAERLGMQEGTVESHLSRGIQALARAVFGSEESEGGTERRRGEDDESGHG